LRKHLADRKITLELTPAAREELFREGYEPAFGARPLKRAIQKLLADPMALKILEGSIQPGEHVVADVTREDGEVVFDFRPMTAVAS
jgi:ATP-dependent Clp protease ATP-binding subunit ClpB